MNRYNVGGLRGEEKGRPDRIRAPEAGEIRRGRREGPSGRSGRGARAITPPIQAQGACWDPR